MKVIVFGGTGTVGRLVVDQAVQQGHQVTVFTRDAATVPRSEPGRTVVEGNVFDAEALAPVVAGHDAVVVALGAGSRGGVRARGTAAVIAAMQASGVRRLIVQSTLGVGDSRGNLTFFWKYVMFGVLLRRAYADHVEQERLTRASGLDWTIVRPAAFTDGPRTGKYRAASGPTTGPV
ncbi:NAD(P)-dependent oxidoreductase [Propionibacteriaceae bacterium Y2011]